MKCVVSWILTLTMILSAAAIVPLNASAAELSDDAVFDPISENDSFDLVPVGSEDEEIAAVSVNQQNYPVIKSIDNTVNGARISWNTYKNNRRYRVYYRAAGGWTRLTTVSGNSYVDSSVADGEERVYTLRCVSEDGSRFTSEYNTDGWINTFFTAPAIATISNTTQGVRLTWNVREGAEDYRVYRKTDGKSWTKLAQLAEGEYTDATAVSGVKYTYTIRMITADGEHFMSDYLSGRSITYVAAPGITGYDCGDNGVVINWSRSGGADAYRVYYKKGDSWSRIGQTSSCSFTDTTIAPGQQRVYTVRCIDGKENFVSDYYRDNAPVTYVYFAAPVIDSLESTFDGVVIRWTRADGAEDYRVYRKTAGKSWSRLAQTDESVFVDTTAVPGVNYTYTLRMISADGESFMSGYNNGKSITYVSAPKITDITNLAGGAKLTWTNTVGADGYRVYYRNNGWTRLALVTGNTYTDTTVQNAQLRKYTVRAVDKNGNFISDFYEAGWDNVYYSAPQIDSIEKLNDGVHLTWTRPEGAEDYRVYRKTAGKSWTRLAQVNGDEYIDTTAQSGTKYFYTIRMISAEDEHFMSDYLEGVSITFCDTPVVTALEPLDNGVRLTWNIVQYADTYKVFFKDGDDWQSIDSTKANSFVDTTVGDGEERVYTVRCYDSDGNAMSDYNREGWSIVYYAPPEILSVTQVNGGYNRITWQAREGVAGYRLYRKSPGGSWARLFDSIEANEYLDETAQAGGIYTYTLRYLDADGNLISSYLSDTKYYVDGDLADGTLESGGNTYRFVEGVLQSGFRTVNGKKYYYDTNGTMVKNNVVGSDQEGWYYVDSSGVCCESEEIRLAAEFMGKYCKGDTMKDKMKYGFMYLANNYPYQRYYGIPSTKEEVPGLAIDCFKNKNANCYRYAAAFCCLARMAGYRARVGIGTTGGLPHGWTEVLVDGQWLICDVDANIPQYHVPAYNAYMMRSHYWGLSKKFSAELVIEDGKATWK